MELGGVTTMYMCHVSILTVPMWIVSNLDEALNFFELVLKLCIEKVYNFLSGFLVYVGSFSSLISTHYPSGSPS